jgi:(R,R)-butanediol dehydrogenase/meso-butanediol dehydrogenase/diacetyl reductase
VFEATGIAAVTLRALEVLSKGGRLVQIGVQRRPVAVDLGRLTLTELEVIGTNALVRGTDFLAALRLVAGRSEGWADVAPVAIPLHALVGDGLEPLANGRAGAVKTLVDPWAAQARPTRTTTAAPGGRGAAVA